MSDVTVDIELTARVGIDRMDMIEHVRDCREQLRLKTECQYDITLDCDCHKEEVTEKEVAECIAFQTYLDDKNSIDISWMGSNARCSNLPIETFDDE